MLSLNRNVALCLSITLKVTVDTIVFSVSVKLYQEHNVCLANNENNTNLATYYLRKSSVNTLHRPV